MIRDQNEGATGDAALWFFDMRLENFATGGGTTQVAMDNVVYGGATPRAPRFEPTYLPPTQPVGPNTPQYFAYAEAAPENYAGDTHQVDIPDVADAKVAVSTATFAAGDQTSASATARGASVYFNVPPDVEVVGHEVSHVVQERMKNSPTVADGQAPLGGDAVGVNTVLEATPSPGGVRRFAASAGGTTSAPQVIEVITALSARPDDPALRAAVAIAATQGDTLDRAIFSYDEAEAMSRLALVKDLALSFDDVRPGATPDGNAEAPETYDPAANFYFNYSVLDYLTLKDADGSPLYLGDGGSIVVPTVDTAGNVAAYSITTWLVTNQSGVFVPIFVSVPEPTSLAAVLFGATLAMRRHRRARERSPAAR